MPRGWSFHARFPQLWKKLWKTGQSRRESAQVARFCGYLVMPKGVVGPSLRQKPRVRRVTVP
jgi:hypothetical protein